MIFAKRKSTFRSDLSISIQTASCSLTLQVRWHFSLCTEPFHGDVDDGLLLLSALWFYVVAQKTFAILLSVS